jgi:hypothetical protein
MKVREEHVGLKLKGAFLLLAFVDDVSLLIMKKNTRNFNSFRSVG